MVNERMGDGGYPDGFRSAVPSLYVRLFGGVEVLSHGVALARPRSRTEMWLMGALLLRANQRVERSWLAGVFWPESHPTQASNNLRRSLSNLRHVLASEAFRLTSPTPQTVSFDARSVFCDVRAFDAAAAHGDRDALLSAVACYRGPLLPECSLDWMAAERRAREQTFLGVLESLADLALREGDAVEAIRWTRRILQLEPLRESAHRRLFQALAASGDAVGLALAYRQMRFDLHEAAQVQPSVETRALYLRLKGALDTPTPAPTLRMPAPISPLVGREEETAEVTRLLATRRLVTLTGSGGVGKTRLALAAAERVAAEFLDGAWYVDLAPVADDAGLVPVIALALGVREGALVRSAEASLTAFLAPKNLLIVLDNCEHLVEECRRLVGALLAAGSQVSVLATSRQRLGVGGETVWLVPPLPVPDPVRIAARDSAAIRACPSVRLFVECARRGNRSFELTDADAFAVARICARLDGLPLALELAAARINVLTPEQLDTRLGVSLALLAGDRRGAPHRQHDLHALIQWSYGLLTDREQALFRRLSVLQGRWDLEAVEAVAAPMYGDAVEGLSRLVERSLVVAERPDSGDVRYRILETVRQFALERLTDFGERRAVQERHARHFLAYAEEQAVRMHGPGEKLALDRLEGAQDNLRAALRFWLQEADDGREGLRLVGALRPLWTFRGSLQEGETWARTALERPGGQTPCRERGRALAAAGNLALNLGHYDQARLWLEEGLALSQRLCAPEIEADTLNVLAAVDGRQGASAAEAHRLAASLANYEALGDATGVALVCSNLCSLARKREEFEQADAYQRRSLALAQARGDRRAMAWALQNRAALLLDQSSPADARGYVLRCLSLCQEVGDRGGVADALYNLGCIARQCGDFATARPYFAESLALRESRGDVHGVAASLVELGAVVAAMGEREEAEWLLRRSVALCREHDRPRILANALCGLGELALEAEDFALARRQFAEALRLCRQVGDRWGMVTAYGGLAQARDGLSDGRGALRMILAGLRLGGDGSHAARVAWLLDLGAQIGFGARLPEGSLRLHGLADVVRGSGCDSLTPRQRARIDRSTAAARAALPPERAAHVWETGRRGGPRDGLAALRDACSHPGEP